MATVTITGLGTSTSVEVPEGSTLSVALSEAGVDPEGAGLNVRANGADVDPDEYTPQDGDQVLTTPRNLKNG